MTVDQRTVSALARQLLSLTITQRGAFRPLRHKVNVLNHDNQTRATRALRWKKAPSAG